MVLARGRESFIGFMLVGREEIGRAVVFSKITSFYYFVHVASPESPGTCANKRQVGIRRVTSGDPNESKLLAVGDCESNLFQTQLSTIRERNVHSVVSEKRCFLIVSGKPDSLEN